MFKEIEFIAQNETVWNVYERPKPASQFLPKWWKNLPDHTGLKFNILNGPNSTVKRCIPTLDMLTAGYIVSLPCDVEVFINNNEEYHTAWLISSQVFDTWSNEQVSNFELDDKYNTKPVFKNLHGWTIKTPPGWSCYITHPIAYPNLPFKSISAIVDTDLLPSEINTPFTFKKNWTGVLEKGTPMFQIIPFERNSWKAKYSFITEQEHRNKVNLIHTKLRGAYAKYFREKRSYT
jgi:hypothetical protein